MVGVNLICAAPFHGGLWQSQSSSCLQQAGTWLCWGAGAAGAASDMRLVQGKLGKQSLCVIYSAKINAMINCFPLLSLSVRWMYFFYVRHHSVNRGVL